MRRLAVTAVILLVGGAIALRHAGNALVVSDPLPERADAIVVLAGSPPERVLDAADLYAAGIAPRIVLTRERHRAELDALARRGVTIPESHEVAAEALVRLGVPRDALVILPPRTDSTAAEAVVVATWACRSGMGSLVVVTSPAHTRRSRTIFRRALGDGVALAVRPASAAAFPAARWWRDRHAAKIVAFEWQKLASHWLVEHWRLAPACERRAITRRRPS